ncbi:MAG: PDZ domain-containing protein [Phycisphaerales bacterium]
MRLLLILSLLAISVSSARAEEGREHVVPTEMCVDFFIVPITLAPRDGAPEDAEGRTLRLLFDTGASTSSIDPDAIERVTGRRFKPGTRLTIHEAAAGPVTWNRLAARVNELDHIGHALNRPFDGILGYDAFDDVLVTLDYPKREMRVAVGELPPPDGREVFRYRGDGRPFIRANIGDRQRDILIDSGSSGELTLKPTRSLRWDVEPKPISAAMRFDRLEMRETGRIDATVRIGPVVFDDPITDLTDGTQLVGTKLLRTMTLTFDQENRRVRMTTGVQAPVRMEPVRSLGASYHPRAAALEIVHMLDRGPAERAGLRVGDMIYAVDGVPLADLGCLFERMRNPHAERMTLAVLRAGESLDVEVALETLVP